MFQEIGFNGHESQRTFQFKHGFDIFSINDNFNVFSIDESYSRPQKLFDFTDYKPKSNFYSLISEKRTSVRF